MAKSDELMSNINDCGEVRKEAGHESVIEMTDDDEWIISILEERERPINASSDKQLQKVQRELREKEENKGYFDPRVVSIGPYHHGKPGLKEAEKLKTRAVCAFIDGNKVEPHEIYKKMQQVVSDARKCYIDGSTDAYDDVAFARMMLIDGCFILQFMYAFKYGPFLDEVMKHVGQAGLRAIIVDIILLENQLPFLVLQALISNTSSPKGAWEELIENFIVQIYIDNMATWRDQTYMHEIQPPLHLLDLMWKRFLGKYSPSTEEEEEEVISSSSSSKKVHQDGPPLPCFSFKTMISCWPKRGYRETNPIHDTFTHSFRSATELKSRGIHFRPSTTFCLNDFTFTSRFGYGLLTLPQLAFGWGMKYWLLNMMAYELAPSLAKYNDLEVCSYIYFMNSLINGAEDVMELRTHNIIHNFYGTDEELAKAFNSMATGGAYLSFEGPIKEVSDQIQKHYNSRMKTWMAQLFHNYFSNPWSAAAFFAATIALVLTFIQTFFPR